MGNCKGTDLIEDKVYEANKDITNILGFECYVINGLGSRLAERFRKLETDHTFVNSITKKLANTPLIKEGLEIIKKEELV